MDLQGKVAVVTGGSRGIGRAICRVLARQGAAVAVNYQAASPAAAEVVGELRAAGARALAVQGDVTVRSQVVAMRERILAEFGQIDILVNNAGICPFVSFWDLTDETWRETLDTNLYGAFVCAQIFGRPMADRRSGSIVNISSFSSEMARESQVHYAASKGGLNALTKVLARSLGGYGIRVNAILSGGVVTDINREYLTEQEIARISRQLPLGRMGEGEDIGEAVAFLASDRASWITGTLLPVEGGRLLVGL